MGIEKDHSPASVGMNDRTSWALRRLSHGATEPATAAHLDNLIVQTPALATLFAGSAAGGCSSGCEHTLREITQQPFVWADTALRAIAFAKEAMAPAVGAERYRGIILAGSGSSHHVGELVAPALRAALDLPVLAVPAGDLLTHGTKALPVRGPLLLISIARSGNSPESIGAVRVAARETPGTTFLHITCNAEGRLAQGAPGDPEAHRLVLHPLTNDRSLVMTSSFTSLALAALSLGYIHQAGRYLTETQQLAATVLQHQSACAAFAAALPFPSCRRAVFLGSGCQYGAAREAALKLTEMTAGAVVALPETHLGLRHGPMAAVHEDTLLVSFGPPTERASRYAADLVTELRAKTLGLATIVQECGSAPAFADDKPIHSSGSSTAGEAFAAIENVAVAQWIGLFASLHHGLSPDAPSRNNVITRVVRPFPIYDVDLDGVPPR